jgi:hypothetical protein
MQFSGITSIPIFVPFTIPEPFLAMASTSEKVSTTAVAASARVHEMVTIVREYATKYGEVAPQGELLSAIKADLVAAADKVRG